MDVFLTGGTGLVGSAVLTALLADGHSVAALARSDESAAALTAAGATVVRGSLADTGVLAETARAADGVVHIAAASDGTDAELTTGLLGAVLPVLARTGRPYLHTSGVWTHGAGAIEEDSPFAPPALTAWRLPLDTRVRAAADDGVRSVVIAPGIVYGRGLGLPAMVLGGPRDDDGALVLPGSGDQHWTTVAADDLGRLYARALTRADPGSYFLGVSGSNPTVREIGEAGAGPSVGSSSDDTTSRLGALGAALELDQRATGAKARRELDWSPSAPSLLAELAAGTYAAG